MNIRERKIELRKAMEEKRASLTPSEREEKQQHIHNRLVKLGSERLLGESENGAAPTLLSYMPYRSEPDIMPFMEWCWEQGIRILLPKVVPEAKTMNLHVVRGPEDVESGAWGIREPKADLPLEQDLSTISMILIPGLAFDRQYGRLGYGGGYYDRFMQLFAARGLKQPLAVAAAFDIQLIEQVPSSWHDFRVDGIVTESMERFQR